VLIFAWTYGRAKAVTSNVGAPLSLCWKAVSTQLGVSTCRRSKVKTSNEQRRSAAVNLLSEGVLRGRVCQLNTLFKQDFKVGMRTASTIHEETSGGGT